MLARGAPLSAVRSLSDYASLAKLPTVVPHLITAAAAMFIAAHGTPRVFSLMCVLLGGGLVAAASNVFNCYFDRDIDANMPRTRLRALPAGRVSASSAAVFGALLGVAGAALLWVAISPIAAAMAVASFVYYVGIYTLVLKRRTPWSAVFSSGAGAFPPIIGWMAVTGQVSLVPVLLFAIVALWTVPHFWALVVSRRSEYEAVGLVALPQGRGTWWALLYSALLVAVALALIPLAHMGALYAVASAATGAGFAALTLAFVWSRSPQSGRRLYLYSIAYIVVLFGAMVLDRLA